MRNEFKPSHGWLRALLTLVAIALLPWPTLTASASADGLTGGDICSQSGLVAGQDCGEPLPPPPGLLGPDAYAAMTLSQARAMHVLEGQAVNHVLAAHQLPPSDQLAARTWARPAAQAELFALVIKAVKTSWNDRTYEQQQVAVWMAELVRRQAETMADQAGAEYAKWAGIDLPTYWRLVEQDAPAADLRQLLATTPEPYANINEPQRGGYCSYTPPAPHEQEYRGKETQTCFTGCSTFTCLPPTPSYDQFTSWGETATTRAQMTSTEHELTALEMATEVIFATARSGILASALVGTISSAILALSPTALAAVLPASMLTEVGVQMADGTIFTTVLYGPASAALSTVAFVATAIGLGLEVLAAIATAVVVGIKVTDDATLPGRLAQRIVDTRSAVADLPALVDTAAGTATMFHLFVQEALPMARADITCDNADPQIAAVCLNQPAPPAAQTTDPYFVVHARGAGSGQTTIASSLDLPGPDAQGERRVRVSGNWFLERSGGSDKEAQSLGLGYRDWDGRPQMVSLAEDAAGHHLFAGYTPDAGSAATLDECKAIASCWTSDTIRYRGADGHDYEATIEDHAAPEGTPSYWPRQPVEGSQMTFSANGFAPGGAVGDLKYDWQMQRAGCMVSCTALTSVNGTLVSGPAYGATVSGVTVPYTWETSGSYAVRLTAVDGQGRTASTTFTVPVQPVAPVLSVPADPGGQSTVGQPVVVEGAVDYAGRLDTETVTVDWGDGTAPVTSGFGPSVLFLATPDLSVSITSTAQTLAAFSGTHVYGQAGTYTATVTVTNQAGQSAREQVMVSVQPVT